jgi:transcriptional regulator with XRE-family HTH domain
MLMNAISRTLRDLRTRSGLGLKRVAPLVGITHSHLSKVENGVKRPSAELIVRLATLYGTDADELLILMGELPPDILEILRNDGKAAITLLRSEYGTPSSKPRE